MLRNLNTSASYKIGRREQSLSSLLFFFAKLLHAKPKEASHEKRERKPVSSSRLCSNNVVVCNCAGWNKNYTDFKRKGGLQVVYEIGSLPDFGHRLETREGEALDPSWFNMAAKWSALTLEERIEKAEKLFERSQNLQKSIEGLSKLKRKILAEVKFLKSVRIIINQPTYNCSFIILYVW